VPLDLHRIAFTVIFGLECIIKVAANGFFFKQDAYLSEAFNWLDFIVSYPPSRRRRRRRLRRALPHPVVSRQVGVFSVLELALKESGGAVGNLTVFRTLRLLRPLRTLTVIPGMKVIVETIFKSLPQLGNVMVLFVFTLFLFGLVGTQIYTGKTLPRLACACARPSGFS
jgi:hypothetical protein